MWYHRIFALISAACSKLTLGSVSAFCVRCHIIFNIPGHSVKNTWLTNSWSSRASKRASAYLITSQGVLDIRYLTCQVIVRHRFYWRAFNSANSPNMISPLSAGQKILILMPEDSEVD